MEKIIGIILLIGVSFQAYCQDEQTLLLNGNELYKKQQFDKAAEQYQKATDLDEKNVKAQYNLGNALYKTKKNDAAEKAFSLAAENTKDEKLRSRALYNKGVSLSRQKKLAGSIDAYKETLRLAPQDEEARENLQKAINDLKKQPPPQQSKDQQDKNKKQENKDQSKPEQNKSKLNQKQVEQMLNALRQDEKKLQQDLQKKNLNGGSNGKDW